MQVRSQWFVGLVLGAMMLVGSPAHAQSWKPTLHDADELYDAAEDLHDRAERFRDGHTMQVTAQLEHLTADLYQLLKRNACAAEVLPMLNATGAALEEASLLVNLSCHLRDDRKAQSELANAQRYFDATAERIQCAIQATLPGRPAYRAPVLPAPAPAPSPVWYQVPPAPLPYGYEVRYQLPASSPTKPLARVMIKQVN